MKLIKILLIILGAISGTILILILSIGFFFKSVIDDQIEKMERQISDTVVHQENYQYQYGSRELVSTGGVLKLSMNKEDANRWGVKETIDAFGENKRIKEIILPDGKGSEKTLTPNSSVCINTVCSYEFDIDFDIANYSVARMPMADGEMKMYGIETSKKIRLIELEAKYGKFDFSVSEDINYYFISTPQGEGASSVMSSGNIETMGLGDIRLEKNKLNAQDDSFLKESKKFNVGDKEIDVEFIIDHPSIIKSLKSK